MLRVRLGDRRLPEGHRRPVEQSRRVALNDPVEAVGIERPRSLNANDPGGSRTRDLRIKSPLLYQLSYRVDQG